MRPAPGLRQRLVVLVGGGVILLLLSAYISTAFVLEERQDEMIDGILDEQMEYSLQLYRSLGRAPELNVPYMRFYAAPPGRSVPDMPGPFAGLGPGDHEVVADGRNYHLEVKDEAGMRFVLAYDVANHDSDFAELLAILGIAFLLSALAALGGIFWLSGHALRHLEALASAVQQQVETPFAAAGMEREVAALADALDDYRARQALLLEREQEFSGHLSHELRTPLSVVRAQAELIRLQHGADERLDTRAQEIMAQVDRMRALIEQLLRLARRTRAPERKQIGLRDLVERIWSDLAQTGGSQTRLDNHLAADTTVVADPLLLELILRNAIANARLHADGALLVIRFRNGLLEIEDVAPARVPAPQLPEDGEGLGLAILRRACQRLGWTCEMTTTATGTRLALRIA